MDSRKRVKGKKLSQFEVTKMISIADAIKLEVTNSQKLILMVLSAHIDDNHQCFPSLKRLCALTNLSMSSVTRSIKRLVELNYITIDKRSTSDMGNITNLYTLNVGAIKGTQHKTNSNVVSVTWDAKKGFIKE